MSCLFTLISWWQERFLSGFTIFILEWILLHLYILLFLFFEGWEVDRYHRSRQWNKKSGSDVKSPTAMNAVACRVSTLDLPRSKPFCLTTRVRSSARYVQLPNFVLQVSILEMHSIDLSFTIINGKCEHMVQHPGYIVYIVISRGSIN